MSTTVIKTNQLMMYKGKAIPCSGSVQNIKQAPYRFLNVKLGGMGRVAQSV
jgi:hypothetical protein